MTSVEFKIANRNIEGTPLLTTTMKYSVKYNSRKKVLNASSPSENVNSHLPNQNSTLHQNDFLYIGAQWPVRKDCQRTQEVPSKYQSHSHKTLLATHNGG